MLWRKVKATDPATGKKRTLTGLVRRRSAEGELRLADDVATGIAVNELMPQCIEPPVEPDCYRVNTRKALHLRGGPGLEFDTINSLAMGQQVHLTQYHGDWAEVDVDGNGFVDGWVFATYLDAVV